MKKFFIALFLILFVGNFAFAKLAQFIITPCGTTHQIPDGASWDLTDRLYRYWSYVDCDITDPYVVN
jgi:hypothetical protein